MPIHPVLSTGSSHGGRLFRLLHWRVARYHVENFGCRTSQADGDAIAAALDARGASAAEGIAQANMVVVNTCTVTAEADRDARAYIRRVRRANPDARIVVTGCYAQRAPEEVSALPGVYAVVGNSHKNQVAAVALGTAVEPNSGANGFVPLAALQQGPHAEGFRPFLFSGDIFAHSDFQLPASSATDSGHSTQRQPVHRTRPSLKIQDGCGNRCTFCVIPSIRGNSRSLPAENVLQAVRKFAEADGQELVISGINLGRWGRDLAPKSRLEDLLAEILETTTLPRLRISSMEPMDWTDGVIALFARWGTGPHPRLARHVHMPLQSGSDSVLRRMHRRYRPWHYAERMRAVRAAAPDAAIGADVMVGFPGETEKEFQENYDFIASLPFTYLHLFPFSARPGTAGWELHRLQPVSGVAVRERMTALRALIDEKNLSFRAKFVGKALSTVTLHSGSISLDRHPTAQNESKCRSIAPSIARSIALTDNFLRVELEGSWPANRMVTAQIAGIHSDSLVGVVQGKKIDVDSQILSISELGTLQPATAQAHLSY